MAIFQVLIERELTGPEVLHFMEIIHFAFSNALYNMNFSCYAFSCSGLNRGMLAWHRHYKKKLLDCHLCVCGSPVSFTTSSHITPSSAPSRAHNKVPGALFN